MVKKFFGIPLILMILVSFSFPTPILRLAVRKNISMWSVQTVQIGGLIKGLEPMIPGAPTMLLPK